MAPTDFIVAIELGSSKITGIAGKKLQDGSIQILATASEDSSGCIRKGVIYNLDKTTTSLTSIINKLEMALKANIGKVYIGIGGQSLRTVRNTEVRHFDEETKITQELIDTMKDSNRNVPIVGYQILGVAPQEYKVGNDLIVEPVGVQTDHIEGRFLNIIAHSNVKENVAKCCKNTQFGIAEDAEDLIAPLALADAVLTASEKRSGCALVDFGADTTTVAIYKNNILRHLAVIPLGANNITKDICSQQIEEEDAEMLKIKYGRAYTEPKEDDDENKVYTLENRCSISAILLEDIVEARINEILDNVQHQIVTESGYDGKLMAGVILTGGGINLANMEEAFKRRTKIEKVRLAKDTQYTLKGIDLKHDGSQTTLIGLLAAGKENCCLIVPEETKKSEQPTRNPNIIEGQLFGKDGRSNEEIEQEEQEERDRQKKIALDNLRKAREEEELKKKRKSDCDALIQKAVELKNKAKYKDALKILDKAKKMDIPEKQVEIRDMMEEVSAMKEKNSFFGTIMRKVDQLINED